VDGEPNDAAEEMSAKTRAPEQSWKKKVKNTEEKKEETKGSKSQYKSVQAYDRARIVGQAKARRIYNHAREKKSVKNMNRKTQENKKKSIWGQCRQWGLKVSERGGPAA